MTKSQTTKWTTGKVALGLVLGMALGIGIGSYQAAAQRQRLDAARRALAAEAARVSSVIQAGSFQDPQELSTVLERARQEGRFPILWIELRSPEGGLTARAGIRRSADLRGERVGSRLRGRQEAYQVIRGSSETVLVESFAVPLPEISPGSPMIAVADGARRCGVIEIAARVDAGKVPAAATSRNPAAGYI